MAVALPAILQECCTERVTTSTPTPPKIFEAVVRAMQQDRDRANP
jgi:hypothetical protein